MPDLLIQRFGIQICSKTKTGRLKIKTLFNKEQQKHRKKSVSVWCKKCAHYLHRNQYIILKLCIFKLVVKKLKKDKSYWAMRSNFINASGFGDLLTTSTFWTKHFSPMRNNLSNYLSIQNLFLCEAKSSLFNSKSFTFSKN